MRIRVIVNPISGRGRGLRLARDVAARCTANGHAVDLRVTGGRGDAERWAAEPDVDVLAACGGDGTANEVLNGAPPGRAVAIVPAGTGNVLAKEFALPRRAPDVAAMLEHGRVRRIDLGRANGRRFAFMASSGLDAEVVRRVCAARTGKFFLAAYLPIAWSALRVADRFAIDVDADGARVANGARYVAIANVASYGGPIRICDRAVPDDGWLDLVLLRDPLRGRLFRVVRALAAGALYRLPDALHLRAKSIRLSSAMPTPWQADGDWGGELPLEISIEAGACSLLVPNDPRFGSSSTSKP